MKKIVYIVLHYGNSDTTIACIESIFKASHRGSIIVVNNGERNTESDRIRDKYKNVDVIVIDTGENLGFARGLNYGIEYASKKMKYDFVFLLNNDTEIISRNIEDLVEKAYSRVKFDVFGPDIISLDGVHCNPRKKRQYSVRSVRMMVLKTRVELWLLRLFGIDITKAGKHSTAKNEVKTAMQDVEVHGSAFVLSNSFIKKEKCLFDKTFLYGEESILKYICDRDGLLLYYDPIVKVLHKEELSTKGQIKNEKTKRLFQLSNVLVSRKIFLRLIKDDKRKKNG